MALTPAQNWNLKAPLITGKRPRPGPPGRNNLAFDYERCNYPTSSLLSPLVWQGDGPLREPSPRQQGILCAIVNHWIGTPKGPPRFRSWQFRDKDWLEETTIRLLYTLVSAPAGPRTVAVSWLKAGMVSQDWRGKVKPVSTYWLTSGFGGFTPALYETTECRFSCARGGICRRNYRHARRPCWMNCCLNNRRTELPLPYRR